MPLEGMSTSLYLKWGLIRVSPRMFIPVGPDGGLQDVWNVDKDEKGTVTKKRLFGVRVSSFLPSSDTNGAGIP